MFVLKKITANKGRERIGSRVKPWTNDSCTIMNGDELQVTIWYLVIVDNKVAFPRLSHTLTTSKNLLNSSANLANQGYLNTGTHTQQLTNPFITSICQQVDGIADMHASLQNKKSSGTIFSSDNKTGLVYNTKNRAHLQKQIAKQLSGLYLSNVDALFLFRKVTIES